MSPNHHCLADIYASLYLAVPFLFISSSFVSPAFCLPVDYNMSFTNLPTRKIGDTEVSRRWLWCHGLVCLLRQYPPFEERLKACLISCNFIRDC